MYGWKGEYFGTPVKWSCSISFASHCMSRKIYTCRDVCLHILTSIVPRSISVSRPSCLLFLTRLGHAWCYWPGSPFACAFLFPQIFFRAIWFFFSHNSLNVLKIVAQEIDHFFWDSRTSHLLKEFSRFRDYYLCVYLFFNPGVSWRMRDTIFQPISA